MPCFHPEQALDFPLLEFLAAASRFVVNVATNLLARKMHCVCGCFYPTNMAADERCIKWSARIRRLDVFRTKKLSINVLM